MNSEVDWWIESISGPDQIHVELPISAPITIGRALGQHIRLTPRQVSREHSTMRFDGGSWRIEDRGSSAGTMINGHTLAPGADVPVRHMDVISIGPALLRLMSRRMTQGGSASTLQVMESARREDVTLVPARNRSELAASHLVALLDAAEHIANASNEKGVAEAAIAALSSATGFENAAFLSVGATADAVTLVSASGNIVVGGQLRVSGSLLRRAVDGIAIHRGDEVQDSGGQSIAGLQISQAVATSVRSGPHHFGYIVMDNRGGSGREANIDDAASLLAAIAHLSALALLNFTRAQTELRLEADRRELFGGAMHALVSAIDAKDPYTRGHSDRVALLAELLAKAAGLNGEECERARLCGIVHDIGKIGVPEAILRKDGKLTNEEFDAIKIHPTTGHAILRDIPQMREILPGVLHHHEKWDGGGYPHRLAGENIPFLGRLLCLADVFDALTSARSYRAAMPLETGIKIIRESVGMHFDPKLAEIFLSIPEADLRACIAERE
ncbi:MAG: HD domain-containing protein [Planctomycetota bacterium]|nr:HD domain-containing protein [Planctomycetota bacterium]